MGFFFSVITGLMVLLKMYYMGPNTDWVIASDDTKTDNGRNKIIVSI